MKRFTIFLTFFFLLTITLSAQTEKRVALVIGNSKYVNNPLTNPANDAHEMAKVLRIAGFTVTEQYDQNADQFNNLVTDFAGTIKEPNTVALFYYAGHGVQYKEKNYLVPIGADNLKVEDQIEYSCIPLERITSKMQDANNKLNIVMLDACRSIAVTRGTRKLQNGLANTDYNNTPELYIEYATGPGRVADDRPGSKNGLFTESLLKYIAQGVELKDLFYKTAKEVKEKSNGAQLPIISGIVTQDFYFSPPSTKVSEPKTENLPADRDKDGVLDGVDRCPDSKGPITLQGCPDSDNDGVIDILDKCPMIAGFSVNKGCPDNKIGKTKWDQCIGLSYCHLTYTSDSYYSKANTIQAYYMLAKRFGGIVSAGIGTYKSVSSYSSYSSSPSFSWGLAPGFRVLMPDPNLRMYIFTGIIATKDSGAFDLILMLNMKKLGFSFIYLTNFDSFNGFGVGVHYCL